MKLHFKISLCVVSIAFLTAIPFATKDFGLFPAILGAASCIGGLLSFLLSGVLYLAKNKEWGKGFLLSSGICLLIGTGVCGTMFLR
jgi:hypothetical protein